MPSLLIKIFLVAFFINLLYEILHSLLYKTCLEAPLPKYVYLMLKAALFDAFAIVTIYYLTVVTLSFSAENTYWQDASGGPHLFTSYLQLSLFFFASVLFAYIWEVHAIKNKRWEYSNKMPLLLGVGLTPLIQLAVTGFLSLYIAFAIN